MDDFGAKFTIGGQELNNRIVHAPMTRARCDPTPEDPFSIKNSLPNDVMVEYYAQRAGAGLIVSEGTQISELAWGWMCAPKIIQDEHAEAWKKVVDAVHAKGGVIYMQLWHLGRQTHSSFHPTTNKIVSASDVKINGIQAKDILGNAVEYEQPTPLTKEEIQETVADFVNGARLAKKAGFDGVEIHSANGYLVDQFLQTRTNKRTDEYGGSMENRMRLLREIVEAIIADPDAFPAERIGFRLSPNGMFGDMGSEDNNVMFPYVAKEMNKYGLAYLHVMDGLGFGFHNLCPPVTMMDFRKVWDGPLICNVGLTKEIGKGMLRSGATDMVAYGRPYISNPDLAERFINDWPLNPDPTYEDWWQVGAGSKGYTDFPFYEPKEGETKDELQR
jgi:N-ethylmaleimide reductase